MKGVKGALAPTICLTIGIGLFAVPTESHAFLNKLFKKKDAEVPAADEQARIDAAASVLFDKGASLEASGNTRGAVSAYQKLVDRYPLSASAAKSQYQIAELRLARGEIDDSFDAFQLLIENYRKSDQFGAALDRQFQIAEAAKSGEKITFVGIPMKLTSARIIEMYEAVIANAPFGANASKAQFSIAEIYQDLGNKDLSVGSYQKVVDNYPRSAQASDAQFRIGQINNITALRSRDVGSNREAQSAMQTFLIDNPDAERSDDARAILSSLQERDLKKDLDIARFYEKTGKPKAATIYYRGILRYPGSEYYPEARERLTALGEEVADPSVSADDGYSVAEGELAPTGGDGYSTVITPEGIEVPTNASQVATANLVKARSNYAGPPAPDLGRLLKKAAPRLSGPTEVISVEDDPGDLPVSDGADAGTILLPPPPETDITLPPLPDAE